MSHSSNHFAIAMVVLAGIMWAGSGIGAQNFFEKCSMNAMELTAFRMMAAGCILIGVTVWQGKMKESLICLRKNPRLWIDIVIYAIVGLMLMHYNLFRGDLVWQCRYGDRRALQLSCHGHLLQCHPLSQAAIERGGHHGLSGCRRYLSSCDRR